MFTRSTVLAAAIESPSYTVAALTAPDSNFNVDNISATPSFEMIERMAADGFSNRASSVGLKSATVSFDMDFTVGGGVPPWADRFLPACGMVKNGTVFAPLSQPPDVTPANGLHTLTIGIYEDGRRKILRGCSGTVKFPLQTGKLIKMNFTFTGAWVDVIDTPLLTPTYPQEKPLRFANAELDFGGPQPCISSMEIDLGNKVILRECQSASDASGYRGGLITGRKVVGNVDPEADLVANDDVFGDWEDQNERAVTVTIPDPVSGEDTEFAFPKMQFITIGDGDREGLRTDPIGWQANRDAAADDEFTLTFNA